MKILAVGDFHGKIEKLEKKLPRYEFDFIIGIGDYAGIDEWYPYIKYTFRIKNRKKAKSAKEFFGKRKFKKLLKKDFEAGKKSLLFLDNLRKPGFFVFGNGDDEWYNYPFSPKILKAKKSRLNFLKKIKNIKKMTYVVKIYQGISFLGFGGYMDAKANKSHRDAEWQERVNKRNKKAEKKMSFLLKKINRKSIFIFHYPPKGIFDIIKEKNNPFKGGSTGVTFFRKAILKHKPSLVLCGHMHEYQGKKKLGNSWVVNPGEGSEGKFAIINIDENEGKVKNIRLVK
ncbi:MAG: metallophosphoesterase [Nanoarchaeota archaeon]